MGNATPQKMLADAEMKIESLQNTIVTLRREADSRASARHETLEAQVKSLKHRLQRAREVRNSWTKKGESQRDLIELLQYRIRDLETQRNAIRPTKTGAEAEALRGVLEE